MANRMTVGELKKLLEKWDDGDEVEVSVPQVAEQLGTEYAWLALIGIDEGFLGSGKPELCLLEAGDVIGS